MKHEAITYKTFFTVGISKIRLLPRIMYVWNFTEKILFTEDEGRSTTKADLGCEKGLQCVQTIGAQSPKLPRSDSHSDNFIFELKKFLNDIHLNRNREAFLILTKRKKPLLTMASSRCILTAQVEQPFLSRSENSYRHMSFIHNPLADALFPISARVRTNSFCRYIVKIAHIKPHEINRQFEMYPVRDDIMRLTLDKASLATTSPSYRSKAVVNRTGFS